MLETDNDRRKISRRRLEQQESLKLVLGEELAIIVPFKDPKGRAPPARWLRLAR
jgi:hypothetical protein